MIRTFRKGGSGGLWRRGVRGAGWVEENPRHPCALLFSSPLVILSSFILYASPPHLTGESFIFHKARGLTQTLTSGPAGLYTPAARLFFGAFHAAPLAGEISHKATMAAVNNMTSWSASCRPLHILEPPPTRTQSGSHVSHDPCFTPLTTMRV